MKRALGILALAAAFTLAFAAVFLNHTAAAPVSGDQILLGMRFAKAGVQAQGAGVLQTGEVGTLSAAVASATMAQVVAAPSTGSIYLRGLLVEKAAASTGSVTATYGTGTNCGTGGTVIAGPIVVPLVGYMQLGVIVPATKALCLTTEGANTSVRAITN